MFEAEEVGLTLAAHLLSTEQELIFPITILIDNQAAIHAGESHHANPGFYLANRFKSIMQCVAHPFGVTFDVTVHWIPGHSDVHGNEEVDKAAKLAAEGCHCNSPCNLLPSFLQHGNLPLSISVLIQAHREETHACWTQLWSQSPRFAQMQNIDLLVLKRSFLKLTRTFSKHHTSLIICLHTSHIPLNKYLHHINLETRIPILSILSQYRRNRAPLPPRMPSISAREEPVDGDPGKGGIIHAIPTIRRGCNAPTCAIHRCYRATESNIW